MQFADYETYARYNPYDDDTISPHRIDADFRRQSYRIYYH